MKKKILFLSIILIVILGLFGCKKKSTFSIEFIDVGHGDAAIVECDGHYMLIDGGSKKDDNPVYNKLVDKGIQHLDILAISHMHEDHIGGLEKALRYSTKIDLTISNRTYYDSNSFRNLQEVLSANGAVITVPNVGDEYELGSSKVKVIDNSDLEENDSLVLLITYKETRFLFTGDIEYNGQRRIAEEYQNKKNKEKDIDLMKIPHHGSRNGDLIRFIDTFMPEYAVISCGNQYGHPDNETLSLLRQANVEYYRTDEKGNIRVESDGKNLNFEFQK